MTTHLTATEATVTDVCEQCHTTYMGLGWTWTYINGEGPFCEECVKKGVTLKPQYYKMEVMP